MELLKWTLNIIEKYGIKPRQKYGQNYVIDEKMIDCILNAADLSHNDIVLEIGAGIGTLTIRLSERVRKVIAVESDKKSIKSLSEVLAERNNIEIIEGDIMKMPLPKVDKIVSNLPFSISTPITFKLLSEGIFKLAVLTYQKEVADRLIAKPGSSEYSRLSVAISLLAEVEKVRDFPPESFYPKPKVFSTIVRIRKKEIDIDWKTLDFLLKVLFSQRRKKLGNALKVLQKLSDFEIDIDRINFKLLERRVFELEPREFLYLSTLLTRRL
ncbi:MAG: 16S rRNA (adenine(1518)-N(6)/adenine(1519)-N(6))-dimethyltransferase RsmA [Candidatus Methanomethyliaceae archaeon]|nr:16S rRNA (adenine(1518)-N(6)/adenine(1519)-N(6))-dimethyltransferase RsmA [Candidatus Methanomethyliaceae archaeon]MDW7970460.1 16S rRNA (adenine(1518)-N(6)/adenine(1519)-N(6))-dimethyltransferase RsmA [Nitrososphaerota archaeon]